MSAELIVAPPPAPAIRFTAEAEAMRDAAIQAGYLIGTVSNAEQNDRAAAAQGELRRVMKLVEDSRETVKRPILEAGRALDAAVKAFRADLASEELRIAKAIGDFQALELAKARAAEQVRQAELRALESARFAEEAKIREQETKIREQLAGQKRAAQQTADAANSAEARAKAEAEVTELRRQQELAAAKSHSDLEAAQERHAQAVQMVPTVEPARAAGQRIKEDWDIVVTDVRALARAHPACVKLTPINSEIRNLLDAGFQVRGVTASKVVKAGVTARKQPEAITA